MPSMNMSVEEFTTPDPMIATEDMTLDALRQLMDQHGIRHFPVLREGAVVGVVSDRDVRLAAGLSAMEKLQLGVADIMVTDPLTVQAGASLDAVAYAMSEHKVGSVIVQDDAGELLGIFTATDALNALIEIVREVNAAAR